VIAIVPLQLLALMIYGSLRQPYHPT
jgi:hypothetical protein